MSEETEFRKITKGGWISIVVLVSLAGMMVGAGLTEWENEKNSPQIDFTIKESPAWAVVFDGNTTTNLSVDFEIQSGTLGDNFICALEGKKVHCEACHPFGALVEGKIQIVCIE